LDQPDIRVAELFAVLDSEERTKARRFHFCKDQKRFIVARGILRILLGRYINKPPAEISLSYSAFGKPALACASGEHPLRFNLSHSHALALYAFTYGRQVGIDVEYIRADLASVQLAERFFSAEEAAVLRVLDPELRPEAFFNCWTRKEAYIKAKGEGLSYPLHCFAVSMLPGEPAALRNIEEEGEEISRWSLQDLKLAPGYTAALAVEKHDWQLRCFEWA
jgi:4'-phosphopantetheinyl transferase